MRLKEKHFILLFFVSLFFMFGYHIINSESAYGGADNISHFRLARYAWKYPHLFLDHWGKPLFTILAAPLSLLGFKGAALFNTIIGLTTAFIAYLTLKKLEYKNAWLIIFFICFTPIYFILMLSSLTEILFSFILILSIYLIFSKKYISSSIIISFIIFSRTEGFILIPLFLAAYIIEKQYKAIPFLLTGFIVFSIAGVIILDDFWWFITQNPYTGAKDLYGSGDITHFLKNTKSINGIPLAIVFCIGILSYIIEVIQAKKISKTIGLELILILSSYIIYLSAHSFVWWKGLGGSLGLIRVMAAVMPLAAIISLRGFNLIYTALKFNQFVQYGITLILLYFIIKLPFQLYHLPLKRDGREQTIHHAAKWLKSSGKLNQKVYYYDTYFCHELGLNPFDKTKCWEKIPDINKIPMGSIIQWDAHFSPGSGNMPLDSLLNNPDFKMLKTFEPKPSFKTYAENKYQVYLFQKIND